MSRTYEALKEAERLRAAQDPAALARRVARAAEEGETLRAELRVCQEQLAALIKRVDAAATIDPAAIDDLGRQVARLAAQQEQLATEPRQLLEAAIQQFKEELDRHWTGLQSQSDQVAGLSLRLEEVQAGVVPTIDTIRRELDELQRRGDELQRAQQTERQTASLSAAAMRVVQESVEESQAAQRGLVERLAVIEDAQSRSDRRLHDILGTLEPLLTGQTQSAGEIDALRVQVAALAEAQARQQQLAEDVQRAQASAEEAARRISAIDEAHASSLALLQQQVAELQTDRGTLRGALGALQSSLAEQLEVAAGLEALRTQMAPLVEAQARQNELADAVSCAQSAADEAGRRIAANEEAQNSTLAALRQQVDALQADSGTWRDVFAAVQSALARQEESAGEIDALRTQVTRMVEAQRRQQQLFEDLRFSPADSDDPLRLAAADSGESADLASLQRQVVALQADRLTLDAFLETRFELLCGILDAELQAKVDELRGSVREPVESERPSRKILPKALVRRASSIAGLRKKTR